MSEHTFDSKKIFFILFVATMVEVAWGLTFEGSSRWLLWSGLLICAYYKGLLIFQYFMHFKLQRRNLKTRGISRSSQLASRGWASCRDTWLDLKRNLNWDLSPGQHSESTLGTLDTWNCNWNCT